MLCMKKPVRMRYLALPGTGTKGNQMPGFTLQLFTTMVIIEQVIRDLTSRCEYSILAGTILPIDLPGFIKPILLKRTIENF